MKPVVIVMCGWAGIASAGGPEHEIIDARNLGRAGTPMVSADGASALHRNPAGLVRQPEIRLELSGTWTETTANFRTGSTQLIQPCDPRLPPQTQPVIEDRAAATRAPAIALSTPIGNAVVGFSYRVAERERSRVPDPSRDLCVDDVVRLFPHRYRGTGRFYERQTVALGAAYATRFGLAAGLSLEGSRVRVNETREIWAGEAPASPGDPQDDLPLALDATGFSAAVHAGVLWGPAELPLEIALSASHALQTRVDGDAYLSFGRGVSGPVGMAPGAARLELPAATTLRGGARLILSIVALETTVEWQRYDGDPIRNWELADVRLVSNLGTPGQLDRIASRLAYPDTRATRSSLDVDVLPGFLTLTLGYAYQTDPSLHTAAAGFEARFEQMVMALGYGYQFARRRFENVPIDSPFVMDGSSISGRSEARFHRVGLALEVAFPR